MQLDLIGTLDRNFDQWRLCRRESGQYEVEAFLPENGRNGEWSRFGEFPNPLEAVEAALRRGR